MNFKILNLLRYCLALTALVMAPSQALAAAGYIINGATVTLMSGSVLTDVGDMTLTSGRLDAGGALIQVTGDWTRTNASFVAGTSTVSFQGASGSSSTLSGTNTFYSFHSSAAGKTILFPAGSTQTVQGTLTLAGTAGNLLRVRSTVAGTYAYLTNVSTNNVANVDSQDNNAAAGQTIRAGVQSISSGHTLNWTFGSLGTPITTTVFNSSITLGWGAIGGTLGYLVNASTASNFTGTVISSSTTNTLVNSLSVAGLTPNTTYHLQIGAIFPGATDYTALNAVATLTDPLTGTQLATAFVSSVTVNWVGLASAAGYLLQASTSPTFTTIAGSSITANIAVTTLTITSLAAHTTYYLRVGGLNVGGAANFSTLLPLQTLAGGPPLATTIQNVSSSTISLGWTGVSDITGYNIQASTASDFSGTLFSTVTTSLVSVGLTVGGTSPLAPNTTYYLRAGALYNGATTYATTLSTPTLTAPLSGLGFGTIGTSSITVIWVPLGVGASNGYRVEASTAIDFSGTIFSTTTTNGSLGLLTVPGLASNTAYYFRAGGVNLSGRANLSFLGAATAGIGVAPSNPTLTMVGSSSITVNWGTALLADGYVLDASTASNFTGIVVSSVSNNASSLALTVQSLTNNTTYFLRAGALFLGATSYSLSTPISTSTLTGLVTGAQISQVFTSSVAVTWTPLASAQGYRVEAALSSDFSGTLVTSTTLNASLGALIVPGLSAGTTYYIRVGGLNWNGVLNPVFVGITNTLGGGAPLTPTITGVFVTSITVTWGTLSGASGYRLEASPASDFSGIIYSSTTNDGTVFRLTVTGLSADSQYYLRVAALWNGTPNYALTSPLYAVTLSNPSSSAPRRPVPLRGTVLNGTADFRLDWRAVTLDVRNQSTVIASYTVSRSTALFGTYTAIASVTSPTYSESIAGQINFYRVVAVDVSGNASASSDIVDSSAQTKLYVLSSDGSHSYVEMPDSSNGQLQSSSDGSQDIEIRLTRRTQDENGVVVRSYQVSAYRVPSDVLLSNFSFASPGMTLRMEYAPAPSSVTDVAPYWLNDQLTIRLANPTAVSSQPLQVTTQDIGIYQVRSAQASGGFGLQAGAPYPRVLTPMRPNENRKLFFLFDNPNHDPVEVSIYDLRNRKIRDLDPNGSKPIPGAIIWDVKDSNGCVVPSGIYLYKVHAGNKTLTGTVVVAR